jgi:hypothetical protein
MKRALFLCAALVTACSDGTPPPAAMPVTKAEAPAPAPVTPAAPVLAATPVAPAAVTVAISPEPRADPNKELAKRVMRALEDEGKIHAAAIDVTAAHGVVTLWGTAATQDERQRASRVAYRVIGVTAVENKLAIASGS